MTGNRSRALVLLVVLGLFVVAMIDMSIVMHREDVRSGVLTSREFERLRERVSERPTDEDLKDRVRELDLQLRREHEVRRWRFEWARWLLLAGLVGWLLALRWFVSMRPVAPRAVERDKAFQSGARERFLTARRHVLTGCAIAGCGVLAVMGVLGFGDRDTLPSVGWVPAPLPAATEQGVVAEVDSPYRDAWPCFRGPGNVGVAGDGDWPTTWSVATGRNIRWVADVPLAGKSSPVVWRNRIFLTAADANQQRVICYDRATGNVLWNRLVPAQSASARGVEIYQDTGYAAPTPAVDGERVCAVFPTGIVVAFDHAGKQLWLVDNGAPESLYSFASSPILYEGLLLLQLDQGAEADEMLSELIAYDAATGNIRYSVPRAVPNSWSSPSIVQTPERAALITTANPWVIAYNPADGAEYWRASGLSGDVAPSPAFGGGMVFATNDGAALLAIRTGGEGDVTETHLAWQAYEGVPDTTSPVSDGKSVLQVAAGGGLTCYDVATGALRWSEWLEAGANASPVCASGRVYLACDDGVTRIFTLGEKFEMVGKGDVGLPIYATPAFVDNEIVLRAKGRLFCIGTGK